MRPGDVKMVNKHFSTLILVSLVMLLIQFASPSTSFSKDKRTDPVKVIQQLKQKPVWEHTEIYRSILRDTSLLNHKGLQQNLINIGWEEWYKKFILGNNWDRNTKLKKGGEEVVRTLGLYQDVLTKMENEWQGNQVHELKLMMLPLTPNNNLLLQKQLKSDIDTIRIFLQSPKKARYKGDKEKRKRDGIWWKVSDPTFSQLIYETYRFHKKFLKTSTIRKLKDWSWKRIKKSEYRSFSLKAMAGSILLDEGTQEINIRSKLRLKRMVSDSRFQRQELIDRLFSEIEFYRNSYPKWKINDLEVDRILSIGHNRDQLPPSSRKNPPGHQKSKGKGHR